MQRTIPDDLDLLDPRFAVYQASDMAEVGCFTTSTTGTGSSVSFASVLATLGVQANRYGIATLETGTTTTGRANIVTPTMDSIVPGYGRLSFSAVIRTPSNLSDATNRYGIKVGFGTLSTSIVDGAGASIRYRDNINSGKWQLMTTDYGGVQTLTDSGITVAASTWYRFDAVLNASASQVQYYINGSLISSITASIQNAGSIYLGLTAMILKSAGTTSRGMYVDFLEFRQEVTR